MSRKTARRAGTTTAPVSPVGGAQVPTAAKLKAMTTETMQEAEIERWRKRTGLTVAEVTQLLDVNLSTWHRWINGKSRPERKYRMRLDQWVERQQAALTAGG